MSCIEMYETIFSVIKMSHFVTLLSVVTGIHCPTAPNSMHISSSFPRGDAASA